MAITATYDGVLSRIRLAATLLGASATYAKFERTVDGIVYTTLRGGSAAIVTSQNAAVDDYEWAPGVARSTPVMVGDVASSIAYTLTLQTDTPAAESNLDYVFASGEIVFLQLPSTVQYMQGGYFAVGDTSRGPVNMVSTLRRWNVPLTGVAAPGPEVIGSAYTWTSVVADFATWTAEIAANATWADLLARTGTPSDVIVP